MKVGVLKNLPRFFLETLKGLRKVALYQESHFLNERNRQICFSKYDFTKSVKLKHNLIVSLTTHKERINYIHYVLDSLYTQTMRPSAIHLYVTRGEYQAYPSVLDKFRPWLNIIEVEELGSYKKFIPALQNARENDLIISLDDDFIYPPFLIFTLYEKFLNEEQKRSLIVFNGEAHSQSKDCGGVGGGLGILWNPRIFNPRIFPNFFNQEIFWENMNHQNLDDTWISTWCFKEKITIVPIDNTNYNKQPFRQDFLALPASKILAVSSKEHSKKNEIAAENMRTFILNIGNKF